MNIRMVFNILGKMANVEAALLLLPTAVALCYKESCAISLLITAAICLTVGILLSLIFRPKNHIIYAREGFAIVALVWLFASLFGALPFYISGEIPSYIDAFFETVSGFTTTGASILTDVEAMSKGLIFWRSFTHWVGGMGVLVFIMAITPNISDRSIHIMRAEMPGPIIGKLVPRVKDTAKILYLIYIVMTITQIILLLCGGMSLFDSVVHTFGTAGTGGFGIKADSVGGYNPYLQWVITIFMFLFGINFNLYYLLLIKHFKSVLHSSELWTYIGLALTSITLITINIYPAYDSLSTAIRDSSFQVSSIMTTTGYSTTDFDLWPVFSKTILLLLMFIGACAGSTAGGLKVSRVVLLFKMILKEIKRKLHPNSVSTVVFEEIKVDTATLNSVNVYFAIYMLCFSSILLLISIDDFDFLTNFSAVASCFNNIGPGLAKVGPLLSFADYSDFSKLALSFAMLLGRLEIFPLLLAFMPSTWIKKAR